MTGSPEQPGIFMLGVESDPLPMQPEMFTVIGHIVVHWSRIESAIDQDISTLRQYPIVRNLADVTPHTFRKKLELWRRSIRALYPTIEVYQRNADAFDEAVKKVAKVRNHLIHGTWSLEQNEDGSFLVTNHRSVRGEWRYDTLWVGQELLQHLLSDVERLSNHIMSFISSRMLHGGLGLLQPDVPPSPDHPAQTTPATGETPQAPPEPSDGQ